MHLWLSHPSAGCVGSQASLKRATSRDRTSPTDAAVPSGGEPAQMAEIRASDIQKAE